MSWLFSATNVPLLRRTRAVAQVKISGPGKSRHLLKGEDERGLGKLVFPVWAVGRVYADPAIGGKRSGTHQKSAGPTDRAIERRFAGSDQRPPVKIGGAGEIGNAITCDGPAGKLTVPAPPKVDTAPKGKVAVELQKHARTDNETAGAKSVVAALQVQRPALYVDRPGYW